MRDPRQLVHKDRRRRSIRAVRTQEVGDKFVNGLLLFGFRLEVRHELRDMRIEVFAFVQDTAARQVVVM
jgi:hypothetical protein